MTRMTDVVLPPTFEQTASFTPGPWVAQKSSIGGYNIVPANKSNFTICRIANAITYIMDFDEAAESDARLIVAAPELLAALEFLIDTKWKSDDRDNMEFVGRVTCYQLERARAAIAAAKGAA